MIDLRAPAHVIGLLVTALGASMVAPMLADLIAGSPNWRSFAEAGFVTMVFGGLVALASRGADAAGLDVPQTFLLTTLTWSVLPAFGALPFLIGAPHVGLADAYFEAMSGLTTTGSTVFTGLETLPKGVLLWRGMLQWFGGLGIIVVAMAFLPAMRIGGMQFFRSEAFDTMGKIMPRAVEIAASLTWLYVALTVACALAYAAAGMSAFDAAVHAMTTVSTGGFANYDASMGHFSGPVEWIAALFMALAAMPFIRLVQLARGDARPLLADPQVRGFLAVIGAVVGALVLHRALLESAQATESLREVVFNVISILTGTGFASADYTLWGAFPAAVFFVIGLIGGCTASTSCSIKIFRYQILLAAIGAQIRRIHSPHGVFTPRYAGRRIEEEVISSVMAFFFLFFMTLAVIAVAMGMLGYDTVTAVSGAATALANVGPGLGPIIGPAGNFAPLSDAAKWLLSVAMLLGRLELLTVFALFTGAFWRR